METKNMKKIYNKLVRDKIPEIIEKNHQSCDIEILSDDAYLTMLDAKLDEELAEYHADQNLEELADLLEVVYAAAIARGYTIKDLESLRLKKRAERGGFNKKILLKSITCPKWNTTYCPLWPRSFERLFTSIITVQTSHLNPDLPRFAEFGLSICEITYSLLESALPPREPPQYLSPVVETYVKTDLPNLSIFFSYNVWDLCKTKYLHS